MSNWICKEVVSLNKKKYKVTLEGMETVVLSLYPSDIRRYKLSEGNSIPGNKYDELLEELYKRSKERALYCLKNSDKTAYMMRKKLKESYYPSTVIERTMEFLTKYGYIDDKRYIENYISYNRKRKSIKNMKTDLYGKGIDRDIVGAVIDEYLEEAGSDEELIIEAYCRKKLKPDMDKKAIDKVLMSLLRKGFNYDIIKSISKRVLEEV